VTSPPPGPSRRRRLVTILVVLGYVAFFGALAAAGRPPFVAAFAKLALVGAGVLAFVWLLRQAWKRLLWRVGRRLAFSYFLVGVLPLGLLALLAALAGYLLGGFLLGHLYRDTTLAFEARLHSAAAAELHAAPPPSRRLADGSGELRFAEYRDGKRVSGGDAAPATWPQWLVDEQARRAADSVPPGDGRRPSPYVALADGTLSMTALAGDRSDGVLVWFVGDLDTALRDRARAWIQLFGSNDPRKLPVTRIQIGGRSLLLRGLWQERDPGELAEFYRLQPPRRTGEPAWLERPLILWMEQTGALRALATGDTVADTVTASLAASPRGLFRSLLSASEQADSTAWLALAGVAVLLSEIWVVAAAMAIFMIVGISRAVNRLSRATGAVARGEFDVRIPARRRDQVGELQRSFNSMAEHLGELVDTAAQKEALDKELELARRVQRDLLPDLIETPDGVDIATMFEPSAAIGGDYFDVLPRPSGRVAIVVADVAGHGLAAGLRMAMVKSALALLADEDLAASGILERLQRLLRSRPGERGFVTLVLAEFAPADGSLELINAGHPPCYLVREAGNVDEILLPSPPLGGLPGPPASTRLVLRRGDAIVWISDGIPECASPTGDPFGYDRLAEALAGRFTSAAELRDRLLEALRRHCGATPVEDDRTLVVLRYAPG